MNLNAIFGLLPVVLAALAQQSATIPVTVGARHFLVSITRHPGNPGHTNWSDAIAIILHVLSGQPGAFTTGVFSVSVTPLVEGPTHDNTIIGGGPSAPAPGFTPGATA